MGLSPAVIDEMTPRELMEAVLYRFSYDTTRQRASWEQMRILAYYNISPHMPKGRKMTPKTLLPLPWDNEGKGSYESMTMDEIREQYKNAPVLGRK